MYCIHKGYFIRLQIHARLLGNSQYKQSNPNLIMFKRRQDSKTDDLTVIDGKDIVYDEEIPIEDIDVSTPPNESPKLDSKRLSYSTDDSDDNELQITSPPPGKRFISETPESISNQSSSNFISTVLSRRPNLPPKLGPSKIEHSTDARPKSGVRAPKSLLSTSDSESDSDDGVMTMDQPLKQIPGEYNPDKYNDLDVGEEVKELFQYITKYTPQHLNLDYKFKPFVPDYIPAVGDIDAFLKVISPEKMLVSGEPCDFAELGLGVLDEPAASQSDSALLHLQLRAVSVTTNKDNKNMIIKKIDNVEKNSKTIDKWILDVSDLHRAKPPPMVKYTNQMPDVDNLMQEWPQKVEMLLRKDGFPSHKLQCSLADYIDLTCAIFDIPIYDKRIQSLHLFFCLFVAIKNSQLFQLNRELSNDDPQQSVRNEIRSNAGTTDQLILD